MRRIVLLLLLLLPMRADAHVGSPDVFLDGNAGPYRLFVTVRMPQVIPGIATIEIRSADAGVRDVTVVPMRLTGPGSELPPTPDRASRSAADPQFFTASLWLMERGSMQVRVSVDGERGAGTLSVPVPATAQRTLTMTRGLGALLLVLMVVLALAIVGIIAGAVRESALDPGEAAPPRNRRRARIATVLGVGAVAGLLAFGNAWWDAEAAQYERWVMHPWKLEPRIDGCRITIPRVDAEVLPDHGHEMHLFLVRVPDMDRIVHIHPVRTGTYDVTGDLPGMDPGRYRVFADIVLTSGFPLTGTAEIEVPPLDCPPPEGDDSAWSGEPLDRGGRMIWDRPERLVAGVAAPLRFHVENADGTPAALEPYMGMIGHAVVLRTDGSVFAHLHPSGSVAMPALSLAMPHFHHQMPPQELAFPYGFPQPGDYRVFVQVKRAGRVETAAFDAHVE